jgi:hypothetical protein
MFCRKMKLLVMDWESRDLIDQSLYVMNSVNFLSYSMYDNINDKE